jgi:UDP-3-O-[3-hydroxymyristoyl] glucosamine N-acyltransferase
VPSPPAGAIPPGAGARPVPPTAVFGKGVVLGEDVTIGPYVVLGDDVRVGAGSRIGAHTVVGNGSILGEHATLRRSHGVLAGNDWRPQRDPQRGTDRLGRLTDTAFWRAPTARSPGRRLRPGNDVEVGANTTIDRGSVGATEIGDGVKIDNLVPSVTMCVWARIR